MTIRLVADGTIELHGTCPISDAEQLQQYLLAAPDATVNWRSCEQAHTAVVQILLAAKPNLKGPPAGDFLRMLFDSPAGGLPSSRIRQRILERE